jgi:ankyrin repeat protein
MHREWRHKTPLHLASSEGFLDVSWLLIEHGADVDAQDNGDLTSIALARGHRKLAQLLSASLAS